jgi:hypothetical protein
MLHQMLRRLGKRKGLLLLPLITVLLGIHLRMAKSRQDGSLVQILEFLYFSLKDLVVNLSYESYLLAD